MKEKTIYFLFTDTGTHLSRMINFCTRESLNHVSIAFDDELVEVYSFGRKSPKNPFIGGFVREDIRGDFLKDSECAIYSFRLTNEECAQVLKNIKKIEAEKIYYRYNFIGLIGVMLQIEINRKNAFFCSQFVAFVMRNSNSFNVLKPDCFVTPADIRNHPGMNLIYQGKLGDYEPRIASRSIINVSQQMDKKSFIFGLSKRVRRLVAR